MRVHINGVEHNLDGPVTGARLHRIAEAQEFHGAGTAFDSPPHGMDDTLSRKRQVHLVVAVPDDNTEIVPAEGQQIVSGGHVTDDAVPWLNPQGGKVIGDRLETAPITPAKFQVKP